MLLRAASAPSHLSASRWPEVPGLQLCLRHQVGVQQALEEQARPEAGGERRRAQMGGKAPECGVDLDISKCRYKPGKPRPRAQTVPWNPGFSGWKIWGLFKSCVISEGSDWVGSGPRCISSSGWCLVSFAKVCLAHRRFHFSYSQTQTLPTIRAADDPDSSSVGLCCAV